MSPANKPYNRSPHRHFKLLEEGKIKPIITAKFPILEATEADELPEKRQVLGSIASVAPNLMQ
jgi:NADPH:quinone reductase-like Zn-dependent oxidoreductase